MITVSYGKIKIWSRVADDRKPKKDNIGEKVWLAGNASTRDTTLLDIHKKGDKGWPEFAGYSVLENGCKRRDLHKRAVRLHPSNFIKRRKKPRK
jgi:hypothetical protein